MTLRIHLRLRLLLLTFVPLCAMAAYMHHIVTLANELERDCRRLELLGVKYELACNATMPFLPTRYTSVLVALSLSDACNDATLLAVSKLRSARAVRILEVCTSKVTNRSVPVICERFVNLQELDLSDARIDAEGVASLHNLPRLECLRLGMLNLDDRDFDFLRRFPQLRELSAVGTRVTDHIVKYLGDLRALRRLDLQFTGFTEEGERLLKSIFPSVQISYSSRSQALKVLLERVEHCKATGNDTLTLVGLNLGDHELKFIPALESVKTVSLGATFVRGPGLSALKKLKNLHFLSLTDTLVDDEGISALAELPGLTMLNLDGTRITDNGLARLCQLMQLDVLSLSKCKITDAGLAKLSCLTKLEDLKVFDTLVTGHGRAALARKLPGLAIHSEETD